MMLKPGICNCSSVVEWVSFRSILRRDVSAPSVEE